MTTELIDRSAVEEKALSIPEQAKALTVSSNDEYLHGESLLLACKELETEIHSAFDPIVEKAHVAHKEAVAQRKKYLDPIEEGRKILKQKMITFQDEMERLRREEQRRIEEEARKRSEDEALKEAAIAEAEGDKEAAEAIIDEPLYVPPVVVPKSAPGASRLSAGRSVWSCEVIDLMALVKSVAEGRKETPISLLLPNTVALNKMAGALKVNMQIPGCRARERKV